MSIPGFPSQLVNRLIEVLERIAGALERIADLQETQTRSRSS